MMKLLRRRVMSEMAARRFAWAAGFTVLATCTALVLKALPEFGAAASVGLVFAVAVGWLVIGWQFPNVARPN
jgi:hypothetical protein